LQQEAIDHGLLYHSPRETPDHVTSQRRLSQQFLQLFLVGNHVMALNDASDKILRASSFEELAALALGNNGKEKAPKTALELIKEKAILRRLYDIANVFVALGIIKKVKQSSQCTAVSTHDPCLIIMLCYSSVLLVSFADFSVGVSQIAKRNSC
jgi:hypothetical protein